MEVWENIEDTSNTFIRPQRRWKKRPFIYETRRRVWEVKYFPRLGKVTLLQMVLRLLENTKPSKTCWIVFSKNEEVYLKVLGRHITDKDHAQKYLEVMVSRINELQIANIKVSRVNMHDPVPNKLTSKGKDDEFLALRIGKLII